MLTLRLRLVHPMDEKTETRDSIMKTIQVHTVGDKVKVNKGNEVSRVNTKFMEVMIEGLATAFLFDYYGPIALAPKHWVKNGTPSDVSEMITHNQKVLIDFCFRIDACGTSHFFPEHKNPCCASIEKIYQKRHTVVNKMNLGIVTTYSGMKENKGALWVHQFLICQAFMKEAEMTKHHNKLFDAFNLLDTNDWCRFIEESSVNDYRTVLCWVGKEV